MATEPLLRLSAIAKRYGAVTALDGVDLVIYPGEVVGLVGDNGAGKSTLVKIVAGTLQQDRGEIYFDGADRYWASPHDALEAGIETLYQDGGLAPHLTISGNLFLGREIYKEGLLGRLGLVDNHAMRTKAMAELGRIGITNVSHDVAVATLSGGQRQAVAIGRAVAWARKLILLDEPTNHLGVKEVDEVLSLIRQVKGSGVSVIFISHTLPHVMEVTDRVVSLRLGRVVRDSPTRDLTLDEVVKDITGVVSVRK
ncbi:MAG TPA: ATP-binding cassette domain-containing protein [Spirochaetia bacterium]|nr:ATP-binding cassette domain-containing protein [Spirochaetia bacterium]